MAASSPNKGQQTLRSLRKAANTDAQSAAGSSKPRKSSSARLTPKEALAKRAAKPLLAKGHHFKWHSQAQQMKDMTIDMQRVRERRDMLEGEEEAGEDETHSLFGTALARSSLINLSLPFLAFSRPVQPKARSLPLVIHHRQAIVEAICSVLRSSSKEVELCGETILDLIPPLITDLSSLLLPSLPLLLTTLIALTAPSALTTANPRLLQRVYDVLGALFRDLAKPILATENQGGMSDVWEVVRRGLGAPARSKTEAVEMDVDQVPVVEPTPTNRNEDEQPSDEDQDEDDLEPTASTSAAVAVAKSAAASQSPPSTFVRSLPANLRSTPQTRRLLGSAFAFLVRKARPASSGDSEESELEQLYRLMISDVADIESEDEGVRSSRGSRGAKGRGKGVGKGRGQEEGSSVLLAEGVTWLTSESCCAANEHLHSRTPAIVRSLLRAVTSLPSTAAVTLPAEIASHALTTVALHVPNGDALEPVFKQVLDAAVAQIESGEEEMMRVGMKALEALVGVKKGARVPAACRPRLFALLAPLAKHICDSSSSSSTAFLQSYTTLTAGILLLTSFQDVLSGGPKEAVEALFSSAGDAATYAAACTLATSLDIVAWSHFNQVVAPLVLSSTARHISASETSGTASSAFDTVDPETNALSLLARLAWSGRLRVVVDTASPAVKVWEKTVGSKCEASLRNWIARYKTGETPNESETHRLLDVLLIVPQLPNFRSSLLGVVAELAAVIAGTSSSDARAAFLESAASPAQVLGASLLAFSRITDASKRPDDAVVSQLASHVLAMIEGFAWHRGVMHGIASLNLAKVASDTSTDTQSRIYAAVLPNLLSEDSLLRLSSLQIGATLFPQATVPAAADMIIKCIEVEEMALTVMGAREKSMKVRKIGIVAHAQLGRDGEEIKPALDIVLRYLTAMLKVNFKPIWPEAIQALALLSQRFPEEVWAITSRQLLTAATRDSGLYISRKPDWALAGPSPGQSSAPLVFEEQELRDHHLEELRTLIATEMSLFEDKADASAARVSHLIEPQVAPERLVVQSYEAQLLALFCTIPDLAQKHSRDFVNVFFGCFQRDDDPNVDESDLPRYVNPDETAKERRLRLLAWLGLFAKFSNPKALYKSDGLGDHFRTLAAFPDVDVQKLALDCLLRWKTPALVANADRLRNLLEPTKLRDELLQFVSTTDAGGLDAEHRADVVPLVIRLTYGLMTSRLGRASTSSGQGRAGRRAAVLGALRTCSSDELNTLVDLTLGPMRKLIVSKPGEPFRFAEHSPNIVGKRQLGFLGLLSDILKHLGKHIVGRWHDLMGVTLNLLYFAQKGIESEGGSNEEQDEVVDGNYVDDEEDEVSAPLRHIRQLSLRRWADFFRLEAGFDYTPYVSAAFPAIISPRLPLLPMENAQAPSALLELFATWSIRRDLVRYLVDYDSNLLPSVYSVLTVRNVKATVVLRVFDIVSSFIEFAVEDGGKDSEIGQLVVKPGVHVLLVQLSGLLASTSSAPADARGDVAQRQVALLCSLAPYIESQEHATNFLTLITPMLRKTNKAVPEKIKTDLLKIFTSLYPLARPVSGSSLYQRSYEVLSSLFASARTRNARLQLVSAFHSMASVENAFGPVASLIEDLNSYSAKRSEEPDFDRRLAAYSLLNEDRYRTMRSDDWIPVINNMLFFVQDPEELAIRSNASFSLRRFVEVASSSEAEDIRTILTRVFLPGLKNSLHSKLEIVRSEVLGVYAYTVEKCSGVPELDQLQCLLVGGDQEANFFYNIVHIQVHRRTRALRRLADEVEAGSISSKIVADIFLPLLDQFVLGSDDKKDPDLVNETVQCLARLAKHLAWSAWNKLAHHYLKYAKVAGSSQRACVRAVVGVLKGFHFDINNDARLYDLTTNRLIPELLKYLEKRDEVDEEIRIPVAEGISAVVQHLPAEPRSVQQSALMMAMSAILRSTNQHVRDLTRQTMCNIVASADEDALSIAVKEIRRALMRGPQLHVLAFTVHAMLVRLEEKKEGVVLDGALEEVVPVVGNDVFGHPSKDRQSQEFRAKTKFKEVRSYKSLDSFQILARHITPSQISSLLVPIRDTIQRTDSSKVMKDVEEVFRAITVGVTANPRFDAEAILDLVHSLVSENSAFLRPAKVARKGRKAAADYHVQLTRPGAEDDDLFSKNAFRFVAFGLELFNAAFRKSQFDLDSPVIISRLEPLVNLIGNTLYSDEPIVLARSMRATASLIRCPLSSVDNAAPVLVKQMLSIVQRQGSTESDLAQSSLRTLSTVIRDCKAATLKEEQLTELLQLIGPDLEEADRQAVLFQLLRAIMSRKFVAPEIYDLMDRIAEILVTNQSSNVREICRSIYLQFLLDYPQGRGRLKSSLAFLTKNLSFKHEVGRVSVLELLSAILGKFATQLIQESADMFFIGLVMVVANDESTRCRKMASELVKTLFTRVEADTQDVLLTMLHAWSGKSDQPQLARTAIQLFGVAIDALGQEKGKAAAPAVLEVLAEALQGSQDRLQEAETVGEDAMDLGEDWQLPYQALQALAHVYKAFPALVSPDNDTTSRQLWSCVRGHLLFPHIWIRTSSARLLGSLYASCSSYVAQRDLPDDHPLSTASLLDAAQKACLQLKSTHLSDSLAMQIVKNLFFASKCFEARRDDHAMTEDAEDDDELGNGAEGAEKRQADPLRWLFTRLSYQARQAHIARPSMHAIQEGQWSLQPASILRFFAAAAANLEKASLERFLIQMATPIFRIVEDPNAQDPQMVELQSLAHEVQELLQAKVGTTVYSSVHTSIRQKVAERRNERKTALALQAINDPEEEARRKAKRNEQKTRQKKRKNAAFADQKGRLGSSKKRREG